MISTAFRTAAFGVRAAYLVRYRPALVGTWLAFNNAGFGANTATLCLALGTWVNKVGHLYYGKLEQKLYAFWAYLLVLSVIVFGPICGVIAAGMEYGGYRTGVSYYGERLRFAASYGLVGVVVGMLILSARHILASFVTHRSKSQRMAPTEEVPGRQPRLVAMFFVCGIFLAVRGATGCVAIYLPEKYMKIWVEDKYFYPLDTLPEYIVLIILCWPTFFARMAQSFPNSLLVQKHGKKGAKKAQEDKGHDRSSHQHAGNSQHADGAHDGEHGVHHSQRQTENGS